MKITIQRGIYGRHSRYVGFNLGFNILQYYHYFEIDLWWGYICIKVAK
jgi:hypothetical protein